MVACIGASILAGATHPARSSESAAAATLQVADMAYLQAEPDTPVTRPIVEDGDANPFSFEIIANATPGQRYSSNPVTLDGFTSLLPLELAATGGKFSYRLNGDTWMSVQYGNAVVYVTPGTTLELAMSGPTTRGKSTATASIGGQVATWEVIVPAPPAAACAGGIERVWLEEDICVGLIPAGIYASGIEALAIDDTTPGTGGAWYLCVDGSWIDSEIEHPRSCKH
ncbi:MAG: hypothetical protein AB7F99_18570 [Vicinamibacterales bacterium]